jgi:O-Antigen ligase
VSASAAELGRRDGGRAELPPRAATRAEPWLSWAGAVSLLVLVVWIVPIKTYKLPVNLPFSLEIYRLVLIVFLGAWVVGIVTGVLGVSAAGLGKPLALLGVVGVLSIVANTTALSRAGLESQAIKSLSYFLSFLVAYLLVCSTITSLGAVELVVRTLVLGAAVIAGFAIYEARSGYDVFDHLHAWFPFLEPTHAVKVTARRGSRLRVRASAQHPIALGAALTMAMPLAAYLASRAGAQRMRLFWGASAVLVVVGALMTVSRTVVLMALAMTVVALLVRRQVVARYWPAALVLVAAVHLAAPHTLGSLYHSFLSHGGVVQAQTARSGEVGSGRIADIGPGLRSWKEAPFFGHGLGTGKTVGSNEPGTIVDPKTGAPIIFDDQYLNSLVSIGFLGLAGLLWFVWGAVGRLVRGARRLTGATGDLIAACAVACAGFGAGMLTFDAFSFVQCTLIFFLVAALGLRTHQLAA